jgi:hypothetical protein
MQASVLAHAATQSDACMRLLQLKQTYVSQHSARGSEQGKTSTAGLHGWMLLHKRPFEGPLTTMQRKRLNECMRGRYIAATRLRQATCISTSCYASSTKTAGHIPQHT